MGTLLTPDDGKEAKPTTETESQVPTRLELFYGGEPPAAARREMYPIENYLDQTFDQNLPRLADRFGLTLEEQQAHRREFATTLRDSGYHEDYDIARLLHDEDTRAQLSTGDEAQRAAAEVASSAEIRAAARDRFGAEQAERLHGKVHDRLMRSKNTGAMVKRILSNPEPGRQKELYLELMEFERRRG